MSRSNPIPTNPSNRRYVWKGSDGRLVYWDKDQELEIGVSLPFEFLVLDQLSTIGGYSDEDTSSYWSNEVRSIGKEELNVRTIKGTKEVGLYKNLFIKSQGAKYAKSIYIMSDGQINNFKATGIALTAWIEFTKANNVNKGKVLIAGKSDLQKKGATKYYIPVFEWLESTEEENAEAIRLDRQLQEYLTTYLTTATVDRDSVQDQEPIVEDVFVGDSYEDNHI